MNNVRVCQRGTRVLAAALGIALTLAVGIPTSASAQPPTAEAISVSWTPTSPPPTSSPFRGVGVGSFTATDTITDAGMLAVAAQDVAAGSPNRLTQQIVFTLNSESGATVTLRCVQTFTDFTDPTAVPGSGSCAIIGGSGAWAGIHGQGKITTVSNFIALIQTGTIDLSIV